MTERERLVRSPERKRAADARARPMRPPPFASEPRFPQLPSGARCEAAARSPADNALPDGLQAVMEAMSGFSLADVVVHRNSAEPARLGALAFTRGKQIHLAPGEERHLPHEAWHVVQQAQGRVKPSVQRKDGLRVNDEEGLEREADLMGAKSRALGARAAPARQPVSARHEGATPQLVSMAGSDVIQLWRAVAGQDGEFEGEPAAHHLHRVGGGEHYKYGADNGSRVNYIHGGHTNRGNVERAIETCEGYVAVNQAGKDECLQYLRELLAGLPRPKLIVVVAPEPKDKDKGNDKKDPPPGGGGGKGGGKKNKIGANWKPGSVLDAYLF